MITPEIFYLHERKPAEHYDTKDTEACKECEEEHPYQHWEKVKHVIYSSEEIFNDAKGPYEEALAKSGYDYQLKYKKVNLQDLNKQKKKRQRYKQMFYCTPPHDKMVETPVGALILKALETTIPPGHVLHPLLNKHAVKVGYSNMPSLMKKISNHNIKISKKESELQEYNPDDKKL